MGFKARKQGTIQVISRAELLKECEKISKDAFKMSFSEAKAILLDEWEELGCRCCGELSRTSAGMKLDTNISLLELTGKNESN